MRKKVIFLGIVIVLIVLIGTMIYLNFMDNKKEFRVTILNTFNEKMEVECGIYQDVKKGYNFTACWTNLEPNESYTFHFNFDKSFNIYKIHITATNYTYSTHPEMHKKYTLPDGSEYGIVRYNGYDDYSFLDGQVHDLLAVIIPAPCGLNISNISDHLKYNIEDTNLTPVDIMIAKIPEPSFVTPLDFSRK